MKRLIASGFAVFLRRNIKFESKRMLRMNRRKAGLRTVSYTACLLCSLTFMQSLVYALEQSDEVREEASTIRWLPETLALIQRGGGYARIARLADDALLCAYSRRGVIYVRRSIDEGVSWEGEIHVVSSSVGNVTNAELLVLKDGRTLLFFNERPSDGVSPYAIGVCESNDEGRMWQAPRIIFAAGKTFDDGCWEPAAVERPSGEILLFFANEGPYRESHEQEITLLRSSNGGKSWHPPEAFSFRPKHRDGMPVPLLLVDGSDQDNLVVAIEDNGLAGRMKPVILHEQCDESSERGLIRGDNSRRESAFAVPLAPHIYAGAPYLAQFPSGETVLSVQSTEGREPPHDHTNSRMVVYVGDATARRFGQRSAPFGQLTDLPGVWNSLFIKNEETVTAVSGTTINGIRGIWAIDGRLGHHSEETAHSSRF